MRQMTVCSKNVTLGALSSRSALSVLVGALFKKINLFLNTPRIQQSERTVNFILCITSKPIKTLWLIHVPPASM